MPRERRGRRARVGGVRCSRQGGARGLVLSPGARPLFARMPSYKLGLGVVRPDDGEHTAYTAYLSHTLPHMHCPSSSPSPHPHAGELTEEQFELLESLLLEAMCGGEQRGRDASTELAHGGVRLQLGATLQQVSNRRLLSPSFTLTLLLFLILTLTLTSGRWTSACSPRRAVGTWCGCGCASSASITSDAREAASGCA